MGKRFVTGLLVGLVALSAGISLHAGDTVTFGVVAPLSGNNIMVGSFVKNGALLAQKHINERGGILGKRLELVFEDEIDNLQASVNAMTKIMNYPEVVAFFGSTYSAFCIAASPIVKEKRIPMLSGGSSANIPKENNEFIWQARMTDDNVGVLIAKAAVEVLGMKNPALIYVAESYGTGLRDQIAGHLEKMGYKVDEKNIYAHNPDDKQFNPIISQIMHSGVDGIITMTHQMPSAILCMQIDAAGVDLPLMGASAIASVVCRETAKEAADGWYSVGAWPSEIDSPTGKAFVEAYRAEYVSKGLPDSDLPSVSAYDSIMLFAEACRLAGTTEDSIAINEGFKKIRAYPGVMSTYTPDAKRCFSTSQFLTLNDNGKALVKDTIYIREP